MSELRTAAALYLTSRGIETQTVNQAFGAVSWPATGTHFYHSRHEIVAQILRELSLGNDRPMAKDLAETLAAKFICYAGILHTRHGENANKPDKHVNPGYARIFEELKLFPGRMAIAVNYSDLSGTERIDAPWKNGLRRLIFVSDMSDALSRAVSLEYLRDEVIAQVTSEKGRRHIWLWLTKRPARMARFAQWLESDGIVWPENLMAMTSVTGATTMGRVSQLPGVPASLRGLSVEPLTSAVQIPLAGIDWVIVGGQSGPRAQPFDLAWARDIMQQCRERNVPLFVKQFGSAPFLNGEPIHLQDGHGGDWQEWPEDLRCREFPEAFRPSVQAVSSPAAGAS
ncbi:MAG: phage Gp37/Gp68 family protein [Verrucomicrobiota bacterium]|nr:phage Gp37/Gp68 family protein [Verrucomicrobiota bacterium]